MRLKSSKILDCSLWWEIIANNQEKARISMIIWIFWRLNSKNKINNINNNYYIIANQSNRIKIIEEKLKEKRGRKIKEFNRLHWSKNCLKNTTNSSSNSRKKNNCLSNLSCKDKNLKKVLFLNQNVILLLKKDMHCLW